MIKSHKIHACSNISGTTETMKTPAHNFISGLYKIL